MSRLRRLFGWVLVVAGGCAAPPTPEPPPVVAVPVPAATAEPESVEPEPPEPVDEAVKRTESGVTWRVIASGEGQGPPGPSDTVEVHYEGWTRDGERFDSSRERGRPATFGVSHVIPGWKEVLQLMVVGDHWRVVIPAELAYGENPTGGRPAGELTFEIELLGVKRAPSVPGDVAAPPANATRTPSGLAYRVLQRGRGGPHPGPNDRVEVHYSGWTTDGKMFDSSVQRGRPATFPLHAVIKGWTEGLQLMRVGDRFRFWIPPTLAYGTTPTRPGAPSGMLVFDVELLAVTP